MAKEAIPERLMEFFRWMEEGHPPDEVLRQIYEYLGNIDREIDRLQHEAQAVKSLLGFLANHHLPHHPGEDVMIGPPLQELPPRERGPRILAAAAELVGAGKFTFTADDVVARIADQGEDLGVRYPTTVVSTVLSRSKEFARTGRGQFEPRRLAVRPAEEVTA